jgi:hypothetical protein
MKNKNKNKTKKLRKYSNGKKRQTKKFYGGNKHEDQADKIDKPETNDKLDINNKAEIKELLEKKHAEDIMQEVENEKTKNIQIVLPEVNLGLGNSEILEKTGELAEGLTLNAIEDTGELLGVDLSNPKETSEKLDDIKELVTSPENVEKVKEIVEEAATVGAVALEAAEPFTEPLIDKTVEMTEQTGSKVGKAGVNIILNTLEEIPGVGVVIGTIRSLNTAALTGLSALDATNVVIDKSADTIKATNKNFEDLMEEKNNVLKRTDESMKEFEEPFKKNVSSISNNKVSTGGSFSKRNSKKYKGKSKKVRFAL